MKKTTKNNQQIYRLYRYIPISEKWSETPQPEAVLNHHAREPQIKPPHSTIQNTLPHPINQKRGSHNRSTYFHFFHLVHWLTIKLQYPFSRGRSFQWGGQHANDWKEDIERNGSWFQEGLYTFYSRPCTCAEVRSQGLKIQGSTYLKVAGPVPRSKVNWTCPDDRYSAMKSPVASLWWPL